MPASGREELRETRHRCPTLRRGRKCHTKQNKAVCLRGDKRWEAKKGSIAKGGVYGGLCRVGRSLMLLQGSEERGPWLGRRMMTLRRSQEAVGDSVAGRLD